MPAGASERSSFRFRRVFVLFEQWQSLLLFPIRCGSLRPCGWIRVMLSALCVQQTLRFFLEAQSGLLKRDHPVIDYSMQCGSFDVGVSVPAACSSAASSVVPALVAFAFPFPSCGLALSAELGLYPVVCFQSWNVDCVICYRSPEMVSLWIFVCVSWTLDTGAGLVSASTENWRSTGAVL